MRRALAALAALALWAGAGAAEPVRLTADQMRDFGAAALMRGYADQALQIAEALLLRDPGDSLALTLKAQAHRLRGELAESEAAARAAWASADTEAERFGAATALAQALSLQDHRTRAQYWLRQAVEHAPNPGARAQALQDFAYVRDQNPLSLQVEGAIRPSNNVNGGARDPLFEYQGIPFILSGDALALSGQTWALGLQGAYRLADDGRVRQDLIFAASQQGVFLSEEARLQAPKAENGDYALGNVEAGWRRRAALPAGSLTTEAKLGHSWYGGADLSNSFSLGLSLERPASESRQMTYGVTLVRQDRLDRPISSSTELGFAASIMTRGPGGDAWQLGLDLARIGSDDIGIDHAEAGVKLGWQAAEPVAGISLAASLGLQWSDYAASPYTADGRQDLRLAASLAATLDKVSYLGFSPVLSLDLSRNESNVALYDSETIGLSLTVKSRF